MAKRGIASTQPSPQPSAGGRGNGSAANVGFEAKLWRAADKLRNNMDAAEYKHVVLGLIFLKYISDTFEEHRAKLVAGKGEFEGADPEERDEYVAHNVFWVPKEARWPGLQGNAKQPTIGKLLDDAMVAIERDNPRVKGVLPRNYGRLALDKHRLGELIDLIGTIAFGQGTEAPRHEGTEGKEKQRRAAKDVLGRVYEYFLTQFASAEGKNGGQFYTPSCVVRTLVEMLSPYKGRVYDLRQLEMVVPPPSLLAVFDATVGTIHLKMAANVHQSRTLATLRDTLLPRLLDGLSRVPAEVRT